MNESVKLKSILRQSVLMNEPLSNHTWYRIGGPCDYYCYPENETELLALIRWCRDNNIPYMTLGKGTNVLISDTGIRGVVIDLTKGFSELRFEENYCDAGSGVQVPKLVLECEKRGLGGLELFAGIPGIVGGALKMNAGCLGREFYQFIEHITVINRGEKQIIEKNKITFHYRHVPLFDDPEVIAVSARMKFTAADKTVLESVRKESLEKRKKTQPISQPSCGSVFKNPPGDFAGRLIEACNLKGYRHGGASVSTLHANFIVNEGGATASDILTIMKEIRLAVKNKFGVTLDPEVRLYGFDDQELKELLNQ